MKRPDHIRCETCAFFQPDSDIASVQNGTCRRRPPESVKRWPAVYRNQWCGEHVVGEDFWELMQPTEDEPADKLTDYVSPEDTPKDWAGDYLDEDET
jgi:hypothetical protein